MSRTMRVTATVLAVLMALLAIGGCGVSRESSEASAPTASAKTSEAAAPAAATTTETTTASETAAPAASGKAWEGKRIGVAHITLYDEWCSAVRDEFVAQAKELGFAECNVQDGNLDAETQQKQVEDFITKKYDMILIDPVSPEGIIPTLEKAEAAGIPVVAFDSGTKWEKLTSYIAWDHGQTGVLSGNYVVDYAKNKLNGKLDVAILSMLNAPHTAIRSEKFIQTIEAGLGKENVNIVFNQDFGGTRDSANNIVANNISKHADIIWCAVDNAAQGARVALQAKGNTETKIISAGAWGKEPFDQLNGKDANYMMCIGVSPVNIVKDSLDVACKWFAGDKANIPVRKDIELSVIDQTNIGDYMKFVK